MAAAANRQGLKFSPVFLDTLALSQALLPELKRFKLDIVSNHLGLPQFNHHRATDVSRADRHEVRTPGIRVVMHEDSRYRRGRRIPRTTS